MSAHGAWVSSPRLSVRLGHSPLLKHAEEGQQLVELPLVLLVLERTQELVQPVHAHARPVLLQGLELGRPRLGNVAEDLDLHGRTRMPTQAEPWLQEDKARAQHYRELGA